MTTYNTGNPIGSTDPRDLYDNSENFDNAVNDRTATTWTDRLGVARKTVFGAFQEITYKTPEAYAVGLSFLTTDANKTVEEAGVIYAPLNSALPFTTSGTFSGDDDDRFYPVQDKNNVIRVTSISAIEAYSAPVGYVFSLNAGGRSGVFDVVAGDFSTELAADTLNGIYVGLSDDLTATTKVAKRRITNKKILSSAFGDLGVSVAQNKSVYQACVSASQDFDLEVQFPEGDFDLGELTTQFDCSRKLTLSGEGKDKTIFTGSGCLLEGVNADVASTTLSADVSFLQSEISVTSVTNVAVGQLVVIRSDEQFEETERSGTKDAAFLVVAIDGTSVKITPYARFSFDSSITNTVKFYKVAPINISGMTASFSRSNSFRQSAIFADFCAHVHIKDFKYHDPLEVDKTSADTSLWYMGVQINRSHDLTYENVDLSFATYGIYSIATSKVRINEATAYMCRHTNNQALGASDTVLRNCKSSFCFAGFDSHQEAMDSYFYNCESTNDTVASKFRGRCDVIDGGYFEKLAARVDTGIIGDTFSDESEYRFVRKEIRNCKIGNSQKQFFGQFIADDGIFANIVIMENVEIINHGWFGCAGEEVTLSNVTYDYSQLVDVAGADSGSCLPSASVKLSFENITIIGNTTDSTLISGVAMSSPYNDPEFYINNFRASNLSRFIRCNIGGDRPNWRVSNGVIKDCAVGISLATSVSWGALDNIEFTGNTDDIDGGTLTRSANSFTLT